LHFLLFQIKCNPFIVDGRIGNVQLYLSQLLIFDLSIDKLVKRVAIPINIAHNQTGARLLTLCAVLPYITKM